MAGETWVREGRQVLDEHAVAFVESDRLQKDYGMRIRYLIWNHCLIWNSAIY